jgi:hypothetical protein
MWLSYQLVLFKPNYLEEVALHIEKAQVESMNHLLAQVENYSEFHSMIAGICRFYRVFGQQVIMLDTIIQEFESI